MTFHFRVPFLILLLFLSRLAFSQHVDEGYYNDWDCGPHGVYGNLRLTKTTGRTCYKIEKAGPGKVVITKSNPSGTVIKVETLEFTNGVISEFDVADQWGNIYEYRSFTPEGDNVFRVTDLVRGKNIYLPCKYAHYIYTGELLTEMQYYSSGGVLKEDANGVAIIRFKRYSDSIRFAERQETSFFDSRRQPVFSRAAGYHTLFFQYDDHDNKITETRGGLQDEPITFRQSRMAKIVYTYDSDNNVIREENRGFDGKIVTSNFGISGIRNDYEGGYLMKITRFDSLGNTTRTLPSGDGVAIIKYEYDNAGNQVRESYYDESGKPMNSQMGVQEIARFFSAGNMLTELSFFDQNGHPCVNRDKINTMMYVRDDKGRVITESSYGLNGQPLKMHSEEVFMIKWKYDNYGRPISESYWADSNTRMRHWNGEYESGTKYDEDGLVTEYAQYDENGRPFIAEDGSSVQKLIYDAQGRLEERQFLHNKKLIDRRRGFTMHYGMIKYSYDESNNKLAELTFWADENKPVDATIWFADSISAHRVVFIYNGPRVIEQRYYKLDAQDPFKTVDCLRNDFINPNGISLGRKNEQ